ncbi:MAG: hypothetical protein JO322_15780 [Candidatus Eremiobacteraeota bacterium]|nr:hypothetical protein [Candidatus Eremiobacteraeota bacterium]
MEVQAVPAAADGQAGVPAAQSTVPAPAQPSVQGAVPISQPQLPTDDDSHAGIAPAIAKLFGGSVPQPVQLNVSYRVEGQDVVTVFTDPQTGKEVAQVPSQVLLGLAQFFDQQSGVTFDKNA